jgi:hypothetical protein
VEPDPTNREAAAAALAEVRRRRRQVATAGHHGRRILLAWAALPLLTLPWFDYVPVSVAGTMVAVAAVLFATAVAVYAAGRRLVPRGGTRRYVLTAAAGSAAYVALVLLAATAARQVPHVWTLAGVLESLPWAAGALVDRLLE